MILPGLVTSSVRGVTRLSGCCSAPRVPAYTLFAPRRSDSSTSARPMPRLAPVTRIILSSIVFIYFLFTMFTVFLFFDECGKLFSADRPPFVEAHFFVRFEVGNRPVTHPSHVFCLSPNFIKGYFHRHKRFFGRLPSFCVCVGKNEPLVFHDFKIDAGTWHFLTIGAAHD